MVLNTGEYLIKYYTRVGSKIPELTETALSIMAAKEMAEETIIIEEALNSGHNPVSFTVDRRVYNSLDLHRD